MKTLEYFENALGIFFFEADALVAERNLYKATCDSLTAEETIFIRVSRLYFNLRRLILFLVFERITDQVIEELPQLKRQTLNNRKLISVNHQQIFLNRILVSCLYFA